MTQIIKYLGISIKSIITFINLEAFLCIIELYYSYFSKKHSYAKPENFSDKLKKYKQIINLHFKEASQKYLFLSEIFIFSIVKSTALKKKYILFHFNLNP